MSLSSHPAPDPGAPSSEADDPPKNGPGNPAGAAPPPPEEESPPRGRPLPALPPITLLQKVRSVGFMLYFYVLTGVMAIAYIPSFALDRKVMIRGQHSWSKGVLWGLRVLVGITMEVRGRPLPLTEPVIIASKHMSAWDTLVTHLLFDDPAVVIKQELTRIPLYGTYCKKSGMIPVDRAAGPSALRAMVANARERLAAGRPLVIYPEGTRATPGAPPDYKPGIAALYTQLNRPVVPVALNSGLFWPPSGLWKRPGTIEVEFLPAIEPGLKKRAFMARLEEAIETASDRLLADPKLDRNNIP